MAFGLSFGSNKQKTNQTSKVDKTDVTNQQESGTKASSGTTTNSTTGSSTSTGTTQQSEQGRTNQQSSGSTTGQTQGQQQTFSDPILAQLEGVVAGLMSKPTGAPASDFDSAEFVRAGVANAQRQTSMGLEDSLNKMFSAVGGTASDNSAVALLADQMRGGAATNLAAIEANLNKEAQAIDRENMVARAGIEAQGQGMLANLLQVLKGGVSTTTGTESQQTQQQQAGTSAGTSSGSQSQSQQQNQQSTQTQVLLELLSNMLSGTTNTKGTETTVGETTKKGGGFGLSI